MKEKEVKKRAWVKNAVIVFLAVMLVLTFFSNTIMNRSLPEVAAQYTSSGSITTRIRGTGTVEAVANFPVKLQQTRTIKDVNIRVGSEVSTGDVLFTLADIESNDLEIAQNELDALLLQLEIMVLNTSGSGDYARENRNINNIRDDLNEAKEDLAAIPYSEEAISAAEKVVENAKYAISLAQEGVESAENSVTVAQLVVNERQKLLDAAEKSLNEVDQPNTSLMNSIRSQIDTATAERRSVQNERDAEWIFHGTNYTAFEVGARAFADALLAAEDPPKAALTNQQWANQRDMYMVAYRQAVLSVWDPVVEPARPPALVAYETITPIDIRLSGINAELNRLNRELSDAAGNSPEYNRRLRIRDDAKASLDGASTVLLGTERTLANAKKSLENVSELQVKAVSELEEQRGYKVTWQDENKKIRGIQGTLEEAIFSLAEKQKEDGRGNALSAIEIREKRKEIEKKREEIEELEGSETEITVTSPVSGIVSQIEVSPGDQVEANATLTVIEVVDRGYSLTIPVTVEQSRRVTMGDNAEVNRGYYWWGGEIRAVLSGIKNDPQNPAQSRLLEFDIYGDVESGTQLNITLGQRSESYEVVVPNSAVRSDTNGTFVLVVLARSSPLGNRYIATRVDVTVLATDDTNTAVAGGLSSWGDFVITTSTAPIEPGMQIRLVDNPW